MSYAKHKFEIVLPNGGGDHEYYVFECGHCFQIVKIRKEFFRWLLQGQALSDFYKSCLAKAQTNCNLIRSDLIVEVPMIPICVACHKRFVFEPGSKGLGGALCRVCYYDL